MFMMDRCQHKGRRHAHLVFESLEPRLALAGTGLTAQYFHNSDFTGLAESRSEAIAHNWGTNSPAHGVDADSFSVRWTGQIEPQFSETYTFRLVADEGVRVWIDGQLVIDDWSPHLRRTSSGTIALQAGQRSDIRIDYFDLTGPAQIEVSWSSPSRPLQLIPLDRLYASPAGLLGNYSDGAGGHLSRIDPGVDFDWDLGAADAGIAADGFSATWSGQLQADFSDAYTFSTISDERVRLWIADELVIENWTNHATTEDKGTKQLEAGKWYNVRLEYYDVTGNAEIELRWASERQTGSNVFQIVPESHLRAAKPTPVTFENPLGIGADPFVVEWQGEYYMTRSNGKQVWINRAEELQYVHDSSPGSDTTLAWSAPAGTNYSDQVWAPELHRFGESWFIYVAASDGNNATHRMHVLQRTAPDPFGSFTYVGQIAAATDRWAIDGTAFEWDGKLYFVWSGWPGFTDGQQNLYIAEMRNPWTLRTDLVLISTPQYAWEKHGLAINEGPQVLIHDGELQIIYSASGYWTPQYALGRLTYTGVGSLLNSASWTKLSEPVFAAANGVVGVGHSSFTVSPDGTEHWIVYHAHQNPVPAQGEIRDIRIQPFTFLPDGTPNFGAPLPLGMPMIVPSKGPEPERSFVIGDFNADGLVDAQDYDTWRGTFADIVFPGTSADGNGNGIVDAADLVVWRNATSMASAAQSNIVSTKVSATTTSDATAETELTAVHNSKSIRLASARVSSPADLHIPHEARDIRVINPILRSTGRYQRQQRLVDLVFATWPKARKFDRLHQATTIERFEYESAIQTRLYKSVVPQMVAESGLSANLHNSKARL